MSSVSRRRHGFLFFVGIPECPGVDVAAPLFEVQVLADAHTESWCQSPHAGIANTDYDEVWQTS